MSSLFIVNLALNHLEIGVIAFTGIGFIILFGISSSSGGYQDLVDTTLKNDEIRRRINRNNDN